MPDRLLSVRADSAGRSLCESGLFPALHPLDAPFWRSGQNIVFREGGVQKQLGSTHVLNIAGTGVIRGMNALQSSDGTQRLFFGDQSSAFMWNGSSVATIATGFTGQVNQTTTGSATSFSFARFGDFMLLTNGKDLPKVWKSGSTASAFPSLPFSTAEIFLSLGPHCLAFNTNNTALNGAISYEWSDEDDSDDWTPIATNAAGNQQIRGIDGEIIAAVNFGSNIVVAGKDSTFLVSYSGAPFYFPYRPLLRGIGACGKHAMVQANSYLFGMSKAGIWQTDGNSYRYIDSPAIRQLITDEIDVSQLTKVSAWHDDEFSMVNFSIPTAAASGEVGKTLGYNYSNKTWTIATYARSAAVPQQGVFDQPFTATVNRQIAVQNTGLDEHTTAISASVTTKPLDLGDANATKVIDAIMVNLRRSAGVIRVRVGSQKDLTDAVNYSDYVTLTEKSNSIFLRNSGDLKAGRFITVEFSSAAVSADWAISGFDLYGTVTGQTVT